MTDDEIKSIYHEVQSFRDYIKYIRRSLAPRMPDPFSFIVDSPVVYQKPITNMIEAQQDWYRREEESRRILQQQAEYNSKLNYLRSLEYLDDLLVILGKNNRWDGIQLLLIFFKESRQQELLVAEQLVQLNRLDDLSKLAKLWKQGRWADIQTVCGLAHQKSWNEVTVRLAEMTTPLGGVDNLF